MNIFDLNIPDVGMPDVNFTYIQHHFIFWSTQGYVTVFGFMFLPLFYMGIIGYVYTRMESATAATVAILIIMSAMGEAFMTASGYINWLVAILQIFVALVMSILVVVLLTRIRG